MTTSTDKATRAYAAITAQLCQLDNDTNEFDFGNSNNNDDFDMSMDDDNYNDEGFAMIGSGMGNKVAAANGTSIDDVNDSNNKKNDIGDYVSDKNHLDGNEMNDNDESFYSLTSNNQRFSMNSSISNTGRRSSGFDFAKSSNAGTFNSSSDQQKQQPEVVEEESSKHETVLSSYTNSTSSNTNQIMMEDANVTNTIDNSITPFDNPNITSATTATAINSTYLESLDGDYRPYHEALQSFIINETNLYNSTNNNNNNSDLNQKSFQTKLKSMQLQYMNRIMRSNYDRSTLLQQNDDDMEYISTTRHLEKEGHFWSLLIRLLESSSLSTTHIRNTKNALESNFIFWDQNLVTSGGLGVGVGSGGLFRGMKNHQGEQLLPKLIQSFITTVVNDHVDIDPAQMVRIVQSYFDEDDEYENEHENYEEGSCTKQQISLPSIVKRRQVILSWIESCHNRSISRLDIFNLEQNLHQGERKKRKIMWKDTLNQFQTKKQQHQYQLSAAPTFQKWGIATSDKIDTFHPDAPILQQMKKTQNMTMNKNPLYGNDSATETYLLSTFLSLLKAGRINDGFELCREYGQAWRVSAWDGNGAFGYEEFVDYDNEPQDGMDIDSEINAKQIVQIGNPQRSFWKRSLWYASQSMHSLLVSPHNNEKQILSSGSLVYEAAITSILADDTSTALKNPILKRHWMDMIWIYYKGKQSRFMEEIYCTHNNAKRSRALSSNKGEDGALPEGTEFEEEEKEQLACTEEISMMNDEVFLRNMEQKYVDKDVKDDDDLSWRPGMCAFLSGMKDVKSYLISNIQSLLANAKENLNKDGYDGSDPKLYEEEVSLRFIFHLVFLLDSMSSEDENLVSFREEVIVPYRNDLLHLYIQRLMMHKPLWKFTCLYASLLPMEQMIDSLTDFWMKSIHDDKNRRLILNQARANLSEGLDLVILRNVVRQTIYSTTFTDSGSIKMFPTSIMKKLRSSDQRLYQDDSIKIHSIHWLCIHDEHYADALVCANMLLRQLFLHADEGENEDEIGDFSNNLKLRTAKIFKSRFLPQDLVQKAIKGGGICDSDDKNMSEANANNMCGEEFESYRQEFESIGAFLEAHNAYEAWKEVIVNLPATAEFRAEGKFEQGSLESEIAIKMEKRKYIQSKRNNGLALIKIAEASYQSMMEVLEGEFLYSRSTEAGVVFSLDEMRQRSEEMSAIQMKCLPTALFLTYRILTETAHWMNEFFEDIRYIFQGDALDILNRIHMIEDDDESTSPYLPESWHARASMLANVINEDETIAACFTKEDIEYFQSLMNETASYLKQCEEREI